MTTLERLDTLIERGVFYDCDWDTLKKARGELAMSDYGKWQPIETAPKDGTSVLLVEVLDYGDFAKQNSLPEAHNYFSAHWNGEAWESCETGGTSDREYTHWMPLPVPPVEGE